MSSHILLPISIWGKFLSGSIWEAFSESDLTLGVFGEMVSLSGVIIVSSSFEKIFSCQYVFRGNSVPGSISKYRVVSLMYLVEEV